MKRKEYCYKGGLINGDVAFLCVSVLDCKRN